MQEINAYFKDYVVRLAIAAARSSHVEFIVVWKYSAIYIIKHEQLNQKSVPESKSKTVQTVKLMEVQIN